MATMTAPKKRRPKPPPNPWPAKLKALRASRKLTQVQAAALLGVSASAWIAWENAVNVPGNITQRLLLATFPELNKKP